MDFPKLEVESHHDIRFLKVELYKAATTHLIENAKLKEFQQSLKAQGPAGDTTFQWAMGFLCSALRDWVDMVFRIAGDSILVNGESYSAAIAPKARTDPFDDKLRSETRQLQQTVEELMERVAECRTQLPQQMEQLTREFLNKQRHRTVSTRETTTLRSMGERDAGVDALNSSYRVVVPDATQQRYTRTLAEFTKVHQVGLVHIFCI
ncbi:hypothetical protein IWQ62_006484 [Dispira parvispora]|uniref:Uncharacterized protein n=1 Tax=Dispira parvispora TaxID=1520584 RepID=A0A9W8E3K9_9FUNG|nr:hypothetical protein IWQ62_006484 [Dispira parvispora]